MVRPSLALSLTVDRDSDRDDSVKHADEAAASHLLIQMLAPVYQLSANDQLAPAYQLSALDHSQVIGLGDQTLMIDFSCNGCPLQPQKGHRRIAEHSAIQFPQLPPARAGPEAQAVTNTVTVARRDSWP